MGFDTLKETYDNRPEETTLKSQDRRCPAQ